MEGGREKWREEMGWSKVGSTRVRSKGLINRPQYYICMQHLMHVTGLILCRIVVVQYKVHHYMCV